MEVDSRLLLDALNDTLCTGPSHLGVYANGNTLCFKSVKDNVAIVIRPTGIRTEGSERRITNRPRRFLKFVHAFKNYNIFLELYSHGIMLQAGTASLKLPHVDCSVLDLDPGDLSEEIKVSRKELLRAIKCCYTQVPPSVYRSWGSLPIQDEFIRFLTTEDGKLALESADTCCHIELETACPEKSVSPIVTRAEEIVALLKYTEKNHVNLQIAEAQPLAISAGHIKIYIAPLDTCQVQVTESDIIEGIGDICLD